MMSNAIPGCAKLQDFVYLKSQNEVIVCRLSDSTATTDLTDGAEKQFHPAGRVVPTQR
jgi:hypothetical protein